MRKKRKGEQDKTTKGENSMTIHFTNKTNKTIWVLSDEL